MKSIFNPYAFNITAKVLHKIKHLDGARSLTLRIKTYEGGVAEYREYEMFVSNTGKPSIMEVKRRWKH